jgi:hypothetical protein
VTPTHPLRSGLVPAEMLPDVLDGWTGPAFHRGDTDDNRLIPVIVIGEDGFGRPIVSVRPGAPGASYYPTRPERLLMPLARAEVRARVCAVMAVGRRCERCCFSGAEPGTNGERDCSACLGGTGYLRPPTPLHAFLPIAEGGRVESAEGSVGLLACSVERVVAGLGAVVDVLPGWRESPSPTRGILRQQNAYASRGCLVVWAYSPLMQGYQWEAFLPGRSTGTEPTEEAAVAAVRAQALAHGFALREGGGLVVPWVGVERG